MEDNAKHQAMDSAKIITDNSRLFKLIFDGLVSNWGLSYSILDAREKRYILQSESQTDLCKVVHKNPAAEQICREQEIVAARIAEKTGKPYSYVCPAGLWNLAVPLIVLGGSVAILIVGQRRVASIGGGQEAKWAVPNAKDFGLTDVQIATLSENVPYLASAQVEHIMDELEKGSRIIGRLLSDLLELGTKREESERDGELYFRRLLQDITHQLISPLTGIAALAENLKDNRVPPERIQEEYGNLVEQSRSVARLAKNFGRIAMLEKDVLALTGTLNLRPQKLTPLVFDCVRDVRGIAQSKGIQINIDVSSLDVLPEIALDADLIRQTFVNLLDNAIKYSYRNTQVIIRGYMDAGNVYLSFVNYGIPIMLEEQERIFDRYYRSKAATQHLPTGTGIGLSVVKQIVEQHNGSISVLPSEHTEEGNRTTFVVRLPKQEQ